MKAGMRLPIESHVLQQAFMTKAYSPALATFGAGYFMCAGVNPIRVGLCSAATLMAIIATPVPGNPPVVEDVAEGGMIMPMIGRARLLRSWGGIMDMSMDGSPFIDKTHIEGLNFNGGQCYGGFGATPASGYCYAFARQRRTTSRGNGNASRPV